MNDSFTLASIPESLTWRNQPSQSTSDAQQQFSITTGTHTDWFIHPAGEHVKDNAPIALFVPPDSTLSHAVSPTTAIQLALGIILFIYASIGRVMFWLFTTP
jgi:hypothetical protein